MKSDKTFLWILGGTALVFCLFFGVMNLPPGFFSGGPARPVPGKVYELTEDNLAVARRHAPVLAALYTTAGNTDGARMARGLNALAERVKDRAIVALGNIADEPGLATRAAIGDLPAWIVYRDGIESGRATGPNADIGLETLLAEPAATMP